MTGNRVTSTSARTPFQRTVTILLAGLSFGSVAVFGSAVRNAWLHSEEDHVRPGPTEEILAEPVRGRVHSEILGVSDGEFIDGSWYLADPRADRVHLVDSGGRLLRSFGGKGDGPGELTAPLHIAVTSEDVWVADLRPGRLSVFGHDGRFDRYVRLPDVGCMPATVAALDHIGNEVYAVRSCLTPSGAPEFPVQRIGADGFVSTLPVPRTLLTRAHSRSGLSGYRMVSLAMAADSARFVLANGLEPCAYVFDREGARVAVRCFDELEAAPLAMEDRERMRTGIREAAPGIRMEIPDHYPYFDRMALVDGALAIRRIVDSDRGEWIMLHGSPAERRFPIPGVAFSAITAKHVLSALPRLEGTEIRIDSIGASER